MQVRGRGKGGKCTVPVVLVVWRGVQVDERVVRRLCEEFKSSMNCNNDDDNNEDEDYDDDWREGSKQRRAHAWTWTRRDGDEIDGSCTFVR